MDPTNLTASGGSRRVYEQTKRTDGKCLGLGCCNSTADRGPANTRNVQKCIAHGSEGLKPEIPRWSRWVPGWLLFLVCKLSPSSSQKVPGPWGGEVGNRVLGIKEGTCCDGHWVFYTTKEPLNTTSKTNDLLHAGSLNIKQKKKSIHKLRKKKKKSLTPT